MLIAIDVKKGNGKINYDKENVASVQFSMHVSIAASICFWMAGTLLPYCWPCTTKHDCNKNESAKNFAILSSRESIFFFMGEKW